MNRFKFPLGQLEYDPDDIDAMIDTLKSGYLTMGARVLEFEQQIAAFLGVKHAVMCNSGSSANLLMIAALTNHKCKKLQPGDEVLIPAVCWSTSLYPLIQYNLKPVFVDAESKTLNIDLDDLEKKINPKTKAVMAVHVLGNSCDMDRLTDICKRNNLILIEDNCESLGSSYKGKNLGTFGEVSSTSHYWSHQLQSIEGGTVFTNDSELFEIIKALRAHGWTRQLKNREEIEQQYPDVDSRFCFTNLGYNLRPTDVQGRMASSQLSKLNTKNDNRKINYQKIQEKLKLDPRNDFLSFPSASDGTDAIWFGVILFLKESINLKEYLTYLTTNGVENRPIISGNFVRQPVIKDLYPELNPEDFPGAEECHLRGLFIGLSCTLMSDESIDELVNILLDYKV